MSKNPYRLKRNVVPGISGCGKHGMCIDLDNSKNAQDPDHQQKSIKGRKNAEGATNIKSLEIDAAVATKFCQKQVGDQKSADHEENADALASIAKRGIEGNAIEPFR